MYVLTLAVAASGQALAQDFSHGTVLPDQYPAAAEAHLPESEALLEALNRSRSEAGLAPLVIHDGLTRIALNHARDMAENGYVDVANQNGVSLLDQVRQSDRTSLIGSFANLVAVLPAASSTRQILEAIDADPVNAATPLRDFSHAGLGTYSHDGRLYVVQLFARVDGTFEEPVPTTVARAVRLQPELVSDDMKPISWTISAPSGEIVARGVGARLHNPEDRSVDGFLNLNVALGNDVYTLRGPYIRMN